MYSMIHGVHVHKMKILFKITKKNNLFKCCKKILTFLQNFSKYSKIPKNILEVSCYFGNFKMTSSTTVLTYIAKYKLRSNIFNGEI